jgi:hypothetical protein
MFLRGFKPENFSIDTTNLLIEVKRLPDRAFDFK